jgi:AraC-like DNA-binding protein
MNTKLNHIQDWLELAKQTGFKASALAEKLNVSRWALHRHTKKLFGQSPQAWLNKQRLVLAVEMLKDCNSIKWLAGELGYKDESHFCHQFKRCYRLSPAKFMARNKLQAAGNGDRPIFLGWFKKANLIPPAAKIFKSATARQ